MRQQWKKRCDNCVTRIIEKTDRRKSLSSKVLINVDIITNYRL